jgi:hypothetical protein
MLPGMETVQQLRDVLMALPVRDRAGLAYELILSLDAPENGQSEEAYEFEIARRAQSVFDGSASGRPVGDVFRDAKRDYP